MDKGRWKPHVIFRHPDNRRLKTDAFCADVFFNGKASILRRWTADINTRVVAEGVDLHPDATEQFATKKEAIEYARIYQRAHAGWVKGSSKHGKADREELGE